MDCKSCKLPFHNTCVGINRADYEKVKKQLNWTCSSKCKSSLETRSIANADVGSDNPTTRELMMELKEIRKSQSFICEKYDDFCKKIDDVVGRFEVMENRLTKLEKENEKLTTQLNKQNVQKSKVEQNDFNRNAIVSGVPNSIADVSEAFNKIAAVVDVDFDIPSNVESIERLFKPKTAINNGNENSATVLDKIPVVIKFTSESSKEKLMMSAKKNKCVFTAAECGIAVGDSKIIIKDHLSPFNVRLLKEAKKLKTDGKYKYVWFQNSSVLIRKDETAKIIKVKSQEDIVKLNQNE